ncbi:MAG TPA: hypothetical protein DCP31_14920 [Cyanobacteria bacterium UBA8543]|nr:hypothetical protein [Cyanobacteria bacterium UBA8543]
MGRNNNRLLILIATCSVAGVILGGTASWAQSTQCLQAKNLTSECLIQDPVTKTIEGMSVGLFAGAGAAAGAVWQLKRQER